MKEKLTPFTKKSIFLCINLPPPPPRPLPTGTLPEQNVILFSSKANREQMGLKNASSW